MSKTMYKHMRAFTFYAMNIITLIVALFIFIFLVTARYTDSCLLVRHVKLHSIHNWLGWWGTGAAVLFSFFGIGAYLVAPLIVWIRYLYYTRNAALCGHERLCASLSLLITVLMGVLWYKIGTYAYGYRAGGLVGYYGIAALRELAPQNSLVLLSVSLL